MVGLGTLALHEGLPQPCQYNRLIDAQPNARLSTWRPQKDDCHLSLSLIVVIALGLL